MENIVEYLFRSSAEAVKRFKIAQIHTQEI